MTRLTKIQVRDFLTGRVLMDGSHVPGEGLDCMSNAPADVQHVLLCIASYWNEAEQRAWPSAGTIAKLTRRSPSAVERLIAQAVEAGEVVTSKTVANRRSFRFTMQAGTYAKPAERPQNAHLRKGRAADDLLRPTEKGSPSHGEAPPSPSLGEALSVPRGDPSPSHGEEPVVSLDHPGSCASAGADALPAYLLIDPFATEDETAAPATAKAAKTEAAPKPRSQAQLDSPGGLVADWKRDHLDGVLTAKVENRMRKVVSEVLAAGYTPDQVRLGLQRLAVTGKAETPAALSGACAEVKTNPALATFAGTHAQWQNGRPVASTAPARRSGASGSTSTMRRPAPPSSEGTAA